MHASDLPARVDDPDDYPTDLTDAPGLLACLDFDGTLAPIVDDPDAAAIDDDGRRAVAALADRPNVRVAVVSGRELADLRERVGLDREDVTYAGNHGLELDRGNGREVHPEAAAGTAAIDDVCADVAAGLDDVAGAAVENKGVTATVHFRQVDDDAVERVAAAVEDAVAATDADLEVLDGKAIFEIRPRVAWDKGRVVEHVAADFPEDWTTMYVGDDTTDEDAFEVVEPDGVGVHVGSDPGTAASRRLPAQADVPAFLAGIAAARGTE